MPAQKGFTLIELMVVITIIAILSMIGVTAFSGVQKNARDAKRRGDIDAIATAFEINYSGGTYILPSNSAFASGSAPKDPLDGQDNCTSIANGPNGSTMKKCWYCIKGGDLIGCNDSAYPAFEISSLISQNAGQNTGTSWMICANLESGQTYCKRNAQ